MSVVSTATAVNAFQSVSCSSYIIKDYWMLSHHKQYYIIEYQLIYSEYIIMHFNASTPQTCRSLYQMGFCSFAETLAPYLSVLSKIILGIEILFFSDCCPF